MATDRDARFSAAIDRLPVDAWCALSAAYLLARPGFDIIGDKADLLALAAPIVWG